MGSGPLDEEVAWHNIAKAANQPTEYFCWCRDVLTGYQTGQVTQMNAAGMMMLPRQNETQFGQLEQSGDAQIVLDYAADIFDGSAYVGAPDSLDRDWRYIAEVVHRHV